MITIAIIGRPNVGKSSLFNRIIGKRVSIVSEQPGVTRDRIRGFASHCGRELALTDTGGLFGASEALTGAIEEQVTTAIDESDAVIFVVDAMEGLHVYDREIYSRIVSRLNKPCVIAVNKADTPQKDLGASEFAAFEGVEAFAVSALHNRGIQELLDALCAKVADGSEQEGLTFKPEGAKIVFLGRPNVGKSSLINAILNESRCITDDVPGTTRDSNELPFTFNGHPFILVDTAGMRRAAKVKEPVEYYSVMRARQSLARADICLLILDAQKPVASQDLKILNEAVLSYKGVIIVVNKIDTIEKQTRKELARYYAERLSVAHFAPILFVSAATGSDVDLIPEAAAAVQAASFTKVQTAPFNNLIQQIQIKNPPKFHRGKRLKIYYALQTKARPPIFRFYINHASLVYREYERFLSNSIRSAFGFEGVSFKFEYKEKKGKDRA